ncbi:hypothetical protein CH352_18035 [Leptospira hartskeerlii]|uniref:Cysteine rich repeat protein n=1 Tax=Leptospira hartskeerlii TaxID=2023177 RepID=A0A2M9X8P0_9LEPT|nr:cysteine rich repeat-containing protein [Leptospira hartskeerlii]PJZ24057.1 hypothetical protein CH357_18185 [Leptospira hartskeerlii]PJZ32123.1 hypothetical protein CH352_18035 [Leptospira hartskeerlii]
MNWSILPFFIILFGVSVYAQGGGSGKSRMGGPGSPCFEDRQKYCSDIPKGQGRIRDCLMENSEKLSPECKEHLNKRWGQKKS